MHMNICKNLFKILMAFTTLISCNNGYTAEEEFFNDNEKILVDSSIPNLYYNPVIPNENTMDPVFSILDFSIDQNRNKNLSKCSIDPTSGCIGIGASSESMKDITYNGKSCFCLKTIVGFIQTHPCTMDTDAKNLVVYDNNNKSNNYSYTIKNTNNIPVDNNKVLSIEIPNNDINIIIPHGVTVYQKDVSFNVTGNNVNLIVLGTMDNTEIKNNESNSFSLFYFKKPANVIIGATAKINYNSENLDPIFQLGGGGNIVLYPGCEINTEEHKDENDNVIIDMEEKQYRNTFKLNGTLYLTKYQYENVKDHSTEDYEKIKGKISEGMKVIFPSKPVSEYTINNTGKYVTHSLFKNLYWIGSHDTNNIVKDYGCSEDNDSNSIVNKYNDDLSVRDNKSDESINSLEEKHVGVIQIK